MPQVRIPIRPRPRWPQVSSAIATTIAGVWLGVANAAATTTAAAEDAPAGGSVIGELLGIVLPLALIIVALLVVLHLARRRFGITGKDTPLTILQILPVGPRERIVLVKTRAGRVFTVGVAQQSVTLITNLDPSDLIAPITAPISPTERLDST